MEIRQAFNLRLRVVTSYLPAVRGEVCCNYHNNSAGSQPVSQSEELRQVEDDGEEEEDEGVRQSGLGAEAELEAVDG